MCDPVDSLFSQYTTLSETDKNHFLEKVCKPDIQIIKTDLTDDTEDDPKSVEFIFKYPTHTIKIPGLLSTPKIDSDNIEFSTVEVDEEDHEYGDPRDCNTCRLNKGRDSVGSDITFRLISKYVCNEDCWGGELTMNEQSAKEMLTKLDDFVVRHPSYFCKTKKKFVSFISPIPNDKLTNLNKRYYNNIPSASATLDSADEVIEKREKEVVSLETKVVSEFYSRLHPQKQIEFYRELSRPDIKITFPTLDKQRVGLGIEIEFIYPNHIIRIGGYISHIYVAEDKINFRRCNDPECDQCPEYDPENPDTFLLEECDGRKNDPSKYYRLVSLSSIDETRMWEGCIKMDEKTTLSFLMRLCKFLKRTTHSDVIPQIKKEFKI